MGQAIHFLPEKELVVFVQGSHLHRGKIPFLGLSKVPCYGVSRILLLWVACSSPRVPGSLCQSLQTSGCMYGAFVTALYLGSRVFQPYLSGPPSGRHRCTHGILHFQALPVVPRPIYLYRCAFVHASIPLLLQGRFSSFSTHSFFKGDLECHFLRDCAFPHGWNHGILS